MTFLGQVRHVMAKDVRQTLWPLMIYLVTVALATVQSTTITARSLGVLGLAAYLVVIAGIFTTALVVQGDSPTGSDAFWAARPLNPTAVLGAKAAFALALLVVALVAQSIVFAWLDEPARDFVRLLAHSSWVYGLWLIIAIVAASITRDLRTFIISLVLVPLAFTFSRIRISVGPSDLVWLRLGVFATTAIGLGGAIALLIYLYRTRKSGSITWTLAVLTIACLLTPIFGNPWPPSSVRAEQTSVRAEPSVEQYSLSLVLRSATDGTLDVGVGYQRPTVSDRLTFADSVVVDIRLKDGSSMLVASRPNVMLTVPPLPLPKGVRTLGASPLQRGSGGSSGLRLTRRQLDSIRVGIASASMDVWTASFQPSVLFAIPLQVGAAARRNGRMVRVHDVGRVPNVDSLASVSLTTVETPTQRVSLADLLLAQQTPRYAIVSPTRNEAVIPMPGARGGSTGAMVLPGLVRRVFVTTFDWNMVNGRSSPQLVDLEWLRDATLHVFAWTPLANEHVRIDNVPVNVWEPSTE